MPHRSVQIFFDDEMFHRELRGGVSRVLCELSEALAATGEIKVILFGGWCKSRAIRAVRPGPALRVLYRARDVEWRIGSLAWSLSTLWRRRAFAAALAADPATVYHPGLYAYDAAIARRAAALVATVHDMQLELGSQQGTHARRQAALKRRLGAAADRIICVSRNTERDLVELIPAARGKTRVVPISSNIVPPRESPRADGAPYYLFVGNRHGYKNGRLVLECFAQIAAEDPRVRLRLCGGKPPGADGELDFPGGAGLRDRIDWGRPGDAELAAAYAGALGLLYPSDYEGFGLPVVEAMRCGCPVVTTRVSSLPEVGGEAVAYVQPRDDAGLVEAMRRLLCDEAWRKELRAAGVQRARLFSWAAAARQAIAVYAEALELRRGATISVRREATEASMPL
jgi:glycosyltransferase involved in cell wall biosynthesis